MFDSVVQTLFGIGLQLEHCIDTTRDSVIGEKLDASIRGLHDIIGLIQKRGELHQEDH